MTCPNNPARSTSIHASQSTADATLTLDTQVTLDASTKTVTVRILAGGTPGDLGATSLELTYPADSLVPVACTANPDDLLDMGTCNLDSELGTVRFNAVQAQAADSAETDLTLVEITFQPVDGVSKTQQAWASTLSLTSQGVFDGDGKDLAWRYAETVEPPGYRRITRCQARLSALPAQHQPRGCGRDASLGGEFGHIYRRHSR